MYDGNPGEVDFGSSYREPDCNKVAPAQSPLGFSALTLLYYLARPSKTAMLRRLVKYLLTSESTVELNGLGRPK